MSLESSNQQEPSPGSPPPELRTLSDVRTLKALAHPVRVALIEALIFGGPMTATQVGEQIGESPTTCSFHLRQLAKYGFVEEAGGGKGRARPWRMTSIGFNIAVPDDQPEAEFAAVAVARMFRERQFERYRTWLETKASYPARWRRASFDSEYLFYLTPEELEQLNDELHEGLFERMHERLTDPSKRPPGSLPVEMLLFSYPLSYPSEDGTASSTEAGE
ncbi:MAG TPA: helix-turn-helix domain-containing protein [Streptosporangiaceae bacterium]|nr:helix-turn-helix domain-containing protein [Streptosporangiaceae bacterium]